MTRDILTSRFDVHARLARVLAEFLPARLAELVEEETAPAGLPRVGTLDPPADYYLADRAPDQILSNAGVEAYILRRGPRVPVNRTTGTPTHWTWPIRYPVRVVIVFEEHGNFAPVSFEGRTLLDPEAGELRASLYEGALITVLLERAVDLDTIHDVELAPTDVAPAFLGDRLVYSVAVDLDVTTHTLLPKPMRS